MRHPWLTLVLLAGLSCPVWANDPAQFEDPADFPLMGDWTGRMTNPKGWPDKSHPELSAQILPVQAGRYKVVLVNDLYRRALPLAEFIVQSDGQKIVIDQDGWDITFTPGQPAEGVVMRGNHPTNVRLENPTWAPPTLGLTPPDGAVILFDGRSLDAW